LPTAAIVLAVGAVGVFAVLASGTGEPVVLTIMAILSTIGVFFILATLAGHLRLTGRLSDVELAGAAADAIDDGIQISGGDGTVRYSSRVFREFLGTTAGGVPRTLEEVLPPSRGRPRRCSGWLVPPSAARRMPRRSNLPRRRAGGRCRPAGAIVVSPGGEAVDGGIGTGRPGPAFPVAAERHLRRAQPRSARRSPPRADARGLRSDAGRAAGGRRRGLYRASQRDARRLAEHRPLALACHALDRLRGADGAELLRALSRREHDAPQPIDIDLIGQQGERAGPAAGSEARRLPGDATAAGFVAAVLRAAWSRVVSANLKTGAARFARLFEAALFGIAFVGRDGRVTRANAAFGRLLPATGSVEGAGGKSARQGGGRRSAGAHRGGAGGCDRAAAGGCGSRSPRREAASSPAAS
jgi:two-component system cell cycle sensor histidine kinase/response regulator CckA